jgi:hypothetical protein
MNSTSIAWGQTEAIQGAGLHSHTCCYCSKDVWCEGEHCKATEKQACEECGLYYRTVSL